MSKKVLMAVYGPIQSDARVMRAARSLYEKGYEVSIISLNSDENFTSQWFSNIFLRDKRKYLSLFSFWYNTYRIAKSKDICLLYLHDYYMPLVGKIYKAVTRRKWVYDAHELIIPEKHSKTQLRMRFFALLERISIKSADLVIAANEERLEVMRKSYHLKKSISVQNISDFSLSTTTNTPKDNIIVYQGAMMKSRHIDFYLHSQKFLPNDYTLLLVGGGDSIPELKRIAYEMGIENQVIFTGKVSQEEMYNYGMRAKVGIISYPLEGLNNYYCAPNKIFEYAALKVPMIGTPQPFLKHMFEKYHIGEIVEWDDTEAYLQTVKKIISNYDSYLTNMDLFLQENCWSNESQKLKDAITDILS